MRRRRFISSSRFRMLTAAMMGIPFLVLSMLAEATVLSRACRPAGYGQLAGTPGAAGPRPRGATRAARRPWLSNSASAVQITATTPVEVRNGDVRLPDDCPDDAVASVTSSGRYEGLVTDWRRASFPWLRRVAVRSGSAGRVLEGLPNAVWLWSRLPEAEPCSFLRA